MYKYITLSICMSAQACRKQHATAYCYVPENATIEMLLNVCLEIREQLFAQRL